MDPANHFVTVICRYNSKISILSSHLELSNVFRNQIRDEPEKEIKVEDIQVSIFNLYRQWCRHYLKFPSEDNNGELSTFDNDLFSGLNTYELSELYALSKSFEVDPLCHMIKLFFETKMNYEDLVLVRERIEWKQMHPHSREPHFTMDELNGSNTLLPTFTKEEEEKARKDFEDMILDCTKKKSRFTMEEEEQAVKDFEDMILSCTKK